MGSSIFGIILGYFRFLLQGSYQLRILTPATRIENSLKRTRKATEPGFSTASEKMNELLEM